jgi:spermidine/putrescine-binding protein
MKKIIIYLFVLLLLTGCSSKKYNNGYVNVLNWSSYIPDDVISDFEEEYNIKVNYGTYSSNEELLAKISSSKSGTYDLIFPSDYMVNLMIKRDIIEEIDKSKLRNLNNINNLFLNQEYDYGNRYSLPFLMATVVIAIDSSKINNNISSYNELINSDYNNNIVLLDDQRIVIGTALLACGYSINDTNKEHLKEAKEWLLKIKEKVKAFDSDSPKTFLITDEVDLGVMWNAEAVIAKENNSNIKIIYPSDGYAISMDNYAIVKNSPNKDNAYLFIDYLLRDDISKRIIEEYPYISTNKNSSNLSDYQIYNVLKNGSYIKNIGSDIQLYDKLWAEIK